MTNFEKELFIFINKDKNNQYLFKFKSGDKFIVEYDGEACGIKFHIIKVINNASNKYCENASIEISKLNYPELIVNVTDYSFYRNTYMSKCNKCGGLLYSIIDYPNLHIKCLNCDMDVASTKFLPIEEDENIYKIKALKNTNLSLEQLSIIKQLFNIGYLEAKKKFENDFILYEGQAVDAFYKKIKLDEIGIKSIISPNADYNIEEIMYSHKRTIRM